MTNIQDELVTRKLIVVDQYNQDRIVGEVLDGVAELRMDLRLEGRRRTGLLLFTHPSDGVALVGPGFGIQLWADGNALIELSLWRDDDGDWAPSVLLATHD